MPKSAPAASRVIRGGRGPRYSAPSSTPSGRVPSAPRLTASAAVVMSAQLQLQRDELGLSLIESIVSAIEFDTGRMAFMHGAAVRASSSAARDLIESYLSAKHDKVLLHPRRLLEIATEIRERVRFHAGPPRRVVMARAEVPAPVAAAPGFWYEPCARLVGTVRPQPPADGRIMSGIASWELHRLGPLPPWAVVCYERAADRVRVWRTTTGASANAVPPLSLVKALVHTDSVPTALGSPADHYFLPAVQRWATPSEVLTMFGVSPNHPIRAVLCTPPVAPANAVSILGRSMHVHAAARALSLAIARLPFTPSSAKPIRYGSACSGIDMGAVAMDHVAPGAWSHTFASETDDTLAGLLVRTHTGRGLRRDMVYADACSPEATTLAPPVDIWMASPPCNQYSRRNHARSDEKQLDAALDLDAMLAYVRVHRPAAVVVENVIEPAASCNITAALLSVPGYDWVVIESDATCYGPMARARLFWVGSPSV